MNNKIKEVTMTKSFHSRSNVDLDSRIKDNYEHAYRIKLPRRMPVILRLDGKAFHTLTKGMNKPFDDRLISCMQKTTKYLLDNIQNAVLAYTQSDEISILIMNYNKFNTSSWFDNNLQKMVSISAAMASSFFTLEYQKQFGISKPIVFDSRAFVLPESEVNNYFVSRQNDCQRNAKQMVGQANYSQKQLHGQSCKEIIEMINSNTNIAKKFDDYSFSEKNGTSYVVNMENGSELIFKENPNIIKMLLIPEEI